MKTKGQIFILSVLILGGVIAMGLIIITVFTSHLRLSREARYSLQAFYLSDSKAEKELYKQFNGVDSGDPPECNNQCNYNLIGCSSITPGVTCWLKATATYQGVTRSSEYYFPSS